MIPGPVWAVNRAAVSKQPHFSATGGVLAVSQ